MIAQGDFRNCCWQERRTGVKFSGMFHTEIYQELQNRLREEAKARWKTYDEKKRSISSTWTMLYARRMPDGKRV